MLRLFTQFLFQYENLVIKALKDHGFPYCTITKSKGYGPDQDGKAENSMVIEIAIPDDDEVEGIETRIQEAIQDICQCNGPNGQTTVLLLKIPCDVNLIRNKTIPQ